MKKIKVLLLFSCILLLLSSCSVIIRDYHMPDDRDTEETTFLGPIDNLIQFLGPLNYEFFPFLQSVLPFPYEDYTVKLSVNNFNDVLKKTDDIMRSMYFDKFRIVLPSGKIIDLLERKIDIIYHYNGSEKETGMLYKEVKNFKPQYIDGKRRLVFDGIKDGDGISIYFLNAKIPTYFVESIRIEFTQTIEWENQGTVKKSQSWIVKKRTEKWFLFTV